MKQTKHFPWAGQKLLMLVVTMLLTVSSAVAKIDSSVFFMNTAITMNANGIADIDLGIYQYDSIASLQMNITLPEGVSYVDNSAILGAMADDADLLIRKYDGRNKYQIQIQAKGTGGSLKEFTRKSGIIVSFRLKADKAVDSLICISNIIGSSTGARSVPCSNKQAVIKNVISYTQLNDTIAAAKAFRDNTTQYDKVKQYLNSVIPSAEAVIDNAPYQAFVDSVKHALYGQIQTAESLDSAMECYDIVTAPDVKVNDATHNALYKALENAINGNPLDKAALDLATENAYRQYWYDRLADAVIQATSFKNKYVADDTNKAELLAAIKEAETRYTTVIDLTKPSVYYKEPYDALMTKLNNVLTSENNNAKNALKAQVDASKAAKNDVIAYNIAKPNDYQAQLAAYITPADSLYNVNQPLTRSTLVEYRNATVTLKGHTSDVVAADSTYAINQLKNAIAIARTDSATIAILSNVVATEIAGYINAAQAVYDGEIANPSTNTQKEVKDATETLATKKAIADQNFVDFKTAYNKLDSVITVATSLKATFDAVSVGAKDYLQDAIGVATLIKNDAKEKTTAELTSATNTLITKKGNAAETNTMAINLNGLITTATTAKDNAVDPEIKVLIQQAIDAVKPVLDDKFKDARTLKNDSTWLENIIKEYVDYDILYQRDALIAKINAATDSYTAGTQTMAYQKNISALAGNVTTATGVKDNASATAKELLTATNTLKAKMDSIYTVDNTEALDSLKKVIIAAGNLKNEIAKTSTVVANALATAITTAEDVRDNNNTAYIRNNAATTLKDAMTTAENANAAHSTAVANLKAAIKTATEAKDGYTTTHTGVVSQLFDAITVAQSVLNDSIAKSTAELESALSTLNTAKTAANDAETAADTLDMSIKNAKDAKSTIVNGTELQKLEGYITTAKGYLTDKTQTATTLTAAKDALDGYVKAVQKEDAGIARTALGNSLSAAGNTKATLAYDTNKNTLDGYIQTAHNVYNVKTKTAIEYTGAKNVLDSLTTVVLKADSIAATNELADSITSAKQYETKLLTLDGKLNDYATEQAALKANVIDPLTGAISASQTVQDTRTSTNIMKHNQAVALGDSIVMAKSRMLEYENTQVQYLANEYTADKYLDLQIQEEAAALAELGAFEEAYNNAETVYASVKAKEGIYDMADVIIARLKLHTASQNLKDAKDAWDIAVTNLTNKINEATNKLGTIQTCHTDIKTTLNTAIQTAQGVLDNKKTKTAEELAAATSALNDAINAAIEADTKWSFTDAAPDYKQGEYTTGNITYTRSGSAIYDGAYATFCLPMDVKVSDFKKVYLAAPFAIYNETSDTYKLFFYEAASKGISTISANTPFFAELKSNDTLKINSIKDETIGAAPGSVNKTAIDVYVQKANTSFMQYDNSVRFEWSGTLAKKNIDTGDSYITGNRSGIFKLTTGYINPFRAYFRSISKRFDAKNANFDIVLDDDNNETTAIEAIISDKAQGNGKIYTIDGKYAGDDINSLNNGVYVIDGRKIVK